MAAYQSIRCTYSSEGNWRGADGYYYEKHPGFSDHLSQNLGPKLLDIITKGEIAQSSLVSRAFLLPRRYISREGSFTVNTGKLLNSIRNDFGDIHHLDLGPLILVNGLDPFPEVILAGGAARDYDLRIYFHSVFYPDCCHICC